MTSARDRLLSIVIPVYNAERYLAQCLDSVCTQTLKDLEIICIDDGSTDGSAAILDDYARRDPRIRVVHQTNAGIGPTRNRGLDEAKGVYVGFADNDDYLDPHMAEDVVALCEQHRLDFCLFGSEYFDVKTGTSLKNPHFFARHPEVPQNAVFVPRELAGWPFCCPMWQCVFRRSFLNANQIRFANLKLGEDFFPFFRALACADRAFVVPKVYYHYRTGHSSSFYSKTSPTVQTRESTAAQVAYVRALASFVEELAARLPPVSFGAFLERCCADVIYYAERNPVVAGLLRGECRQAFRIDEQTPQSLCEPYCGSLVKILDPSVPQGDGRRASGQDKQKPKPCARFKDRHAALCYGLEALGFILRLRPHQASCATYRFWRLKRNAVKAGWDKSASGLAVECAVPLVERLKKNERFKAWCDAVRRDAFPKKPPAVNAPNPPPVDPLVKDLEPFDWQKPYADVQGAYVSKSDILSLIESPTTKVVSFAVYDTLLTLPAVFPSDLSALAEAANTAVQDVERDLLFPREIVREYYDAAVRAGKRVIAISDAGRSSAFLKSVLAAKGYDKIDVVYAACEERAWKDDGELFKRVLQKEDVAAKQMVHIGADQVADFESPIKMGIPSACVPTLVDVASRPGSLWNCAYGVDGFSKDPMTRILLGGVIMAHEKEILGTKDKGILPSRELMESVGIAPMVMIAEANGGYVPLEVYGLGGTSVWRIFEEYFRQPANRPAGVSVSIQEFDSILGKWRRHLKPAPSNDVLRPLLVALFKSPYCEARHLGGIGDSVEEIYKSPLYAHNRLLGLGLCDPSRRLAPVFRVRDDFRLGVHIHLFHADLTWEFVSYAKNLPRGSAIFVTTPHAGQMDCIREIFRTALPAVETTVILSQNRGRDVAPWLVETRAFYESFDCFCHVHSKKSEHTKGLGDPWRGHLLDNLLAANAIASVCEMFTANPRLGVIAPEPYHRIMIMPGLRASPLGADRTSLESLMARITGRPYSVSPSDLAFSPGTMFWFRPSALKPLYDLGLQYVDFPEEPMEIDGTLAHAIERSLGCVCAHSGCKVGFLRVAAPAPKALIAQDDAHASRVRKERMRRGQTPRNSESVQTE